jgi:hypothetical protein
MRWVRYVTPTQYALIALSVILVAVLLAAFLPGGVGWFAAVLFPIAFFIVVYKRNGRTLHLAMPKGMK